MRRRIIDSLDLALIGRYDDRLVHSGEDAVHIVARMGRRSQPVPHVVENGRKCTEFITT
jgi:hypothetical protein